MTRDWPPYRTVRDLVHAHAGRPAVVMGGGPSLLPTLDAVAAGRVVGSQAPVYISANDHGAKALRARARADEPLAYVLCLDKIERRCRQEVWEDGRTGPPWGVPLISRHMWADYRLVDVKPRFSGPGAAWFARLIGCDPIILAGMDCYVGDTYWHSAKARSSARFVGIKHHLMLWRRLAQASAANYQVFAGELTKIFTGLDAQPLVTPATREQLLQELGGVMVQFQFNHELSGRPFSQGTTIEVNTAEAEAMQRARMARRVGPRDLVRA